MLIKSRSSIKKVAMRVVLAAFLFFIILAGCGEDDGGGEDGPVGSAAVSWSMICPEDDPLSFIAQVYDASKTYLTYGGPWNCTAGTGTVSGIRSGSGRIIVLFAEDQTGAFVYRGEKGDIDIPEAVVTDAGEITTYSYVADLEEPYYGPLVDDNASLCLAWDYVGGAARYKIEIADNILFSKPAVTEINQGPPYEPVDLEPGSTYYWRVFGIDLYANQGAASDTGQFKPGPTVIITNPSDGANFNRYDDEIPFQGNAVDEIDGRSISGEDLLWSSSITGPLGTGELYEFFANVPGTHIISLSATSIAGYTGIASITINIAD